MSAMQNITSFANASVAPAERMSPYAAMGRSYAPAGQPGEKGFALPAGWWLLPSVLVGAGIWVMLIRALFF